MDPPTSKEENIPRGCLKLNNKIYPVYEGLNTIGRNPEAIINIKNLNISQQHAIITVVDESSHYISDFRSSNGTVVDNKTLKPLKLYKLLNGASIKFADVFCTYKKLDSDEHVLDTFEETQNFSETFYETNTQAIHLPLSDEPIINEMPTQVMDPTMLSFNEMPTQVIDPAMLSFNKMPTHLMPPKPLSINEMATQVFNYNDSGISKVEDDAHDNSSNDSLDFVTMRKATQSQGFVLNQSDSDTQENPVVPVKLKPNKNILTSDSEEVQSSSDIHPVKLNSSKGVLSSDSEGMQSVTDTKKELTIPEEEESCSQICPVKTSIKNPIESDSDSDTEEYVPHAQRRKSRYVISDDDETDIEDADKAETTMNNTDIIPNTQEAPQKSESSRTSQKLEQSSMDSFRLELSERVDENGEETKNKSLTSIAQDHVYCQEPKTSDLVIADDQGKNSPPEDHIYCRSLENSQNLNLQNHDEEDSDHLSTKTVENTLDLKEDATKASAEEMEARVNDISPQTGAELTSGDQNLEEGRKSSEETLKNDEGAGEGSHLQNTADLSAENSKNEEKVDIFDQPTQQLGLNFVDDETQSVVGDKEADSELTEDISADQKFESTSDASNLKKIDENDQYLEVKKSDKDSDKNDEEGVGERSELHNKTENAKEEKIEDIFDQPTQKVALDFKDDDTLSIVGDQDSKLTEEWIVPSDQKSEEQQKDRESASEHVNLDQSTESKNEDDIFGQPTQRIDLDFVDNKEKEVVDDDMYFQPTQKLSTVEEHSKSILEDDIYIQPTQQINRDVPSTSKADDFYTLPTQKLKKSDNDLESEEKVAEVNNENNLSGAKDHEFARPFELFGSTKKSEPTNDEDGDESFFLPPTQALEYLHKEDEATTSKQAAVSDHNSNSNEVEDQLEMLFYSQSDHRFVATQQLVDVLEDKNDNEDVIEDSMIEENDISKTKKFNTVDSIRMILDDDLEADDKNKGTETKTSDLDSDGNQEKRTNKRKLPKENISNQEEKKEDVKKGKRTRKEKAEELKEDTIDQTNEKDSEADGKDTATRTRTRSKKNNDKESELSEDINNDKVEDVTKNKRTRRGKAAEAKENNIDQRNEKDSEKESSGKGRPTRKGARGKKDENKDSEISEDNSNDKVESIVNMEEMNVNKSKYVKKYERIRKEETKESEESNIEQANDGKVRPNRKATRGRKDDDTGSEISEVGSSRADTPVDIEKKNQRKNTEDDNKDKRQNKKNRGRNDDTGSEISQDGSSGTDTPVNIEKEKVNQVKRTKGIEDIKKSTRQTKQKSLEVVETADKKEGKEPETDAKVKSVRSSKRGKKDDDKDSDSSEAAVSAAHVPEEKESNIRNRGKRKIVDDLNEELNQTKQNPPVAEVQKATGSVTRKRNLKTTAVDSGDEFEPKISKVDTPKRTPARQKNKNIEPIAGPETPTTRTSVRTKKLKMDEDEVISVPSTSSVTNEVISISSSSSVSDEPVKKSRRLSANSRAQRNEEEKTKQQGPKARGRKASVQQSPPVVPATPERSKRQLKPKVVFTMMDDPELESLIRHLGGSVVDTVEAATVLVTVSVKRSQKLLCAVGQGKPICSTQWLFACKKSYSFLDPWDYILVDKEAEKKWDFSLRESLNRSVKCKLLENHTFQLIVNAAADVLKGAIEACGGKCVTRNLPKADTDNKIIVSSNDNKSKFSKIVKQDPSIKVVEAEAIFDGTLRQEFRFDNYLLT